MSSLEGAAAAAARLWMDHSAGFSIAAPLTGRAAAAAAAAVPSWPGANQACAVCVLSTSSSTACKERAPPVFAKEAHTHARKKKHAMCLDFGECARASTRSARVGTV